MYIRNTKPIYSKTALEYWQSEIALKATGTQTNYKRYFQDFLNFIAMNADQVLTQRIQDNTSTDQIIRHRFESLFKEYLADCKNRGYQNGTLQSIYASIRSFFEYHYYPLQMRKKDYPKSTANGVRRASKKAIIEILEENNTSLTAKILTANDTGLGASDIVALNCDIILDNPNKDFIMITAKRIKTGDIIKTFLGEESIQALKKYLELRRKGTRDTKPETITRESPLFITHKQTRLPRCQLSNNIMQAFNRHGEKCMSAHSLRKKLQTDLEKGQMPTTWIDQILGHQLINSRDAYSLPTDEELQEAYNQVRIIPKQIIQQTQQEPEIIEAKTLTEAKQAIAKGYKYADKIDGIRLYTKPIKPSLKTNFQLTKGQSG